MLRTVCSRATTRVAACKPWRMLSTKAEELPADLLNTKETESEDGQLLRSLYNSHFNAQTLWPNASLFEVRSGSYMPLDAENVFKHLPEGLPRSMIDEFAFTHNNSWMVRDTTRLLCRLLEEKESKLKGSVLPPTTNHQSPGYFSSIQLPRLTDRPEWEVSQHNITRYGVPILTPNDALSESSRAIGEDKMVLTKGGQSLLEQVVQKVDSLGGVPDKILLSGDRGCGKSFALAQLVLHARMRNWLVVYIPNGWDHVMSGTFVEPVGRKDAKGRGLFDNSQMSAFLIRNLLRAHGPLLRTMPIKETGALRKYNTPLNYFKDSITRALKVHGKKNPDFLALRTIVLEEEDSSADDRLDKDFIQNLDLLNFELKTLEDYLLLGLAIKEVAGYAFTDLVRELRQVDSVPVLFAVDGFNTWDDNSAFSVDGKAVFGKDISVPRALSFIEKKKAETDAWTIKNGLCIAANSYNHVEGRTETYEDVLPSVPLRIKMPNYNQTEFLSAMAYYLNHAPIDGSLSYEDVLLFRMHTMSNGQEMREQATPFLMPRTVRASEAEMQVAMMMSVADFSNTDPAAAVAGSAAKSRNYRKHFGRSQSEDTSGEELAVGSAQGEEK